MSTSLSGSRPAVNRGLRALMAAAMAFIAAACGDDTTPASPSALPQSEGLVLIEPPPLIDDLGIPATGLPDVRLGLEDGCITAMLGNGETVTLHFFDGYAGFDGTTLFFRPFGEPDSVPAQFEHGDRIGITGHDASPALGEFLVAPPDGCPNEGTVAYSIRRIP